MSANKFKALVVEQADEGKFVRSIKDRSIDDLPEGQVLVRVHYSSLNYKDALSSIGNKGVTRNFPHTPGVDASGVVEQSTDPGYSPGDEVIVHAYDLGCNTSGGFGQYIRVPSDWVIKLPAGITLKDCMIFGTAGFTAAYSIYELIREGAIPEKGEVFVSGATGGVGSISVAILSRLGYEVAASTGKADQAQFLLDIGAKEVIGRDESVDDSGRPMLKGRWAGVVDTVGGGILATAIKTTKPFGVVTCCGNVASPDLPLNVYPFILRGVKLIGIDSQNCPMDLRIKIWENLANEWKLENSSSLVKEVGLDGLENEINLILKGGQVGRVLVNLT